MDGITQKYSVFDFFNLLIAGATFLNVLMICQYPKSIVLLKKLSEYIGASGLLLFLLIITYISSSLVSGMVLQVISNWFIKEKLGWKAKVIGECLNGKGILENRYRTERLFAKALWYLNIREKRETLNVEETSAFFAYCVYYLHVRQKDAKTEKIRETQGLSELFTCVFWTVPVLCIIILFVQLFVYSDMNFNMPCIVVSCVISLILGFLFYYRYKISCCNRIRMVLSIYDACTEEIYNEKKDISG